MNQITHEPLHFSSEELAVLSEMLESAHASLLVEIRHTDHRSYRDELRRRLELVEHMIKVCRSQPHTRDTGTATPPYERGLAAGHS